MGTKVLKKLEKRRKINFLGHNYKLRLLLHWFQPTNSKVIRIIRPVDTVLFMLRSLRQKKVDRSWFRSLEL